MHTTNSFFIQQVKGGDIPSSWDTGDTLNQKARFIAAYAWETIKSPADPSFTDCDLSHRENLIAEVEGILSGNTPSANSPFAAAAYELYRQVQEVK